MDEKEPSAVTDAEENKTMAILAYILFLIPLLSGAYKTSPFVKYHTNQATVLWIAAISWNILISVISQILFAFYWRLGMFGTLLNLVGILFLALAIIGILNAVNGQTKPLPLLGGFTLIK